MSDWLRRLFGQSAEPSRPPQLDDAAYERFDRAKQQGLEAVLGPMHNLVLHAIIGFELGGPVHMYAFPNALPGTAWLTKQFIQPDGTGVKPSSIGTYEFIAFTRHPPSTDRAGAAVLPSQSPSPELRFRTLFTTLGHYALDAKLEPGETSEVEVGDGLPRALVLFDEFVPVRGEFRIDGHRHGLLLCLEVLPTELAFARKHGSRQLLKKLMDAGHYPYSDLDREPVV